VSLASPTQTTLGPYLGARDRIRLVVRDVRLNPDFALTLALGLNELATNAAKYGALASPAGRITLTARVETGENGDEFRLAWQDGGPAVDTPVVTGLAQACSARPLSTSTREASSWTGARRA
jgi:two-component system, chemotaxis family, CheB/CheR fusion protein